MKLKSTVLVLILISILGIAGCENQQKNNNQANTTKAEQTVNSFLSQVKTGDYKEALKYYIKEDTTQVIQEYEKTIPSEFETILKAQTSKLEYEIISSKVEDKIATVTTRIKSPDMEAVLNQSILKIGSIMLNGGSIDKNASEIANVVIPKIKDPSIKKYENEVDIILTYDEQDKNWYINNDEQMLKEIANSVFGNIEVVIQKLQNLSQ
jgi:hypothetical protein